MGLSPVPCSWLHGQVLSWHPAPSRDQRASALGRQGMGYCVGVPRPKGTAACRVWPHTACRGSTEGWKCEQEAVGKQCDGLQSLLKAGLWCPGGRALCGIVGKEDIAQGYWWSRENIVWGL